ncbi:hypothetical protein BC940DRAFT_313229 [Gongronella butleri]|nr:hypothetical protein BC940DRAFT_313229 [Gongronella butleri]
MYPSAHADPYRSEYPPPPPLPADDLHHQMAPATVAPPSVPYSAPSHRGSFQQYAPSPAGSGYGTPSAPGYPPPAMSAAPHYTNIPGSERHSIAMAGHDGSGQFQNLPLDSHNYNAHGDPSALTYEEYQQIQNMEASSYHKQPAAPQTPIKQTHYQNHNNNYPSTAVMMDYADEADASTPMVQKVHGNPYKNEANKRKPGRHGGGAVTMAPEDEAAAYRPKPYHDDRRNRGSGCAACCAATSCCSCFCFLLSLAFLAGGIALIVSASIFAGKCAANCDGYGGPGAKDVADACGTFCNKILHDALLYSGIGIAALAGIAIIWRIGQWMCAAHAR